MATAPSSPPEVAVDPVTVKLDIMDYELKNLNENITTSISKCLNQNITMIKNYVQVKVDEFKMLRKEIDKQQKEIDEQRQKFDEDVQKFKAQQKDVAKRASSMRDNIIRVEVGGTC